MIGLLGSIEVSNGSPLVGSATLTGSYRNDKCRGVWFTRQFRLTIRRLGGQEQR